MMRFAENFQEEIVVWLIRQSSQPHFIVLLASQKLLQRDFLAEPLLRSKTFCRVQSQGLLQHCDGSLARGNLRGTVLWE